MKTDITGIAKSIMQVRSSLKAEASGNSKDQNLSVSFFELMSQNTLSSNVRTESGSDELVYRVESSSNDTTQNAYDTCANPVKNVAVKEEAPPEEILSESSELLEEYEEEIRAVLKEQFGITDEEIDAVLDSLGISLFDLGNIQDLTAFVQELTGEDIGALFLSEAFQNVKDQVMQATETLCAELGITKEEWAALAESLSQQMHPAEEVPVSAETVGTEAILQTEGFDKTAGQTSSVQEDVSQGTGTEVSKEQTITAVVQNAEEPQKEVPSEQKSMESAEEADAVVQKNPDSGQETADSGQESDLGQKKQELPEAVKAATPDMANEHAGTVVFSESQSIMPQEAAIPQEAAVPYASQVDAIELIEQIARQVRVTITSEVTSMEMQLNPENLGKIYLNVTEKEGAVRAQITAQNQVVKEALETQVAELRQTLNQQGIKVDAIEVTVASHEFEQNLEENARQEEQMRQQMEESQKKARRSLNLSELDGLSGLMTEEEQLVAQIMRDNGNQVDLTA